MKKACKLCKSALRQLLISLLAILIAVLLILFFLLVLIPIYIYRLAVFCAKTLFRPDLAGFVHPRSAICATDDLFVRPTLTLLVVNILEGDVDREDLERFRQLAVTTLVQKLNEKGELQYPELQQCYHQWLGFVFWKWVDKFDIKDHINIHVESETRPMNEVDIAKLRLQLVRKPYVRGQSPWEFIVVRNYKPVNDSSPETTKTVIISRAHHGVADGYTILEAFMNLAVITERGKKAMQEAIPTPNYPKFNICQIGLHYLQTVLSTPYHLSNQLVNGFASGRNPLQAARSSNLTRQVYPASTRVSMDAIRTIRQAHQVTFTSVILAGLAGGLRKFLKDNEMNKVPKYVYVVVPLPWPNHPLHKLINYWTCAILTLPVGLKSAEERLRFTHANWEQIKRSTLPTMNFYLVPLLGRMTVGWMRRLGHINCSNATMILSNFPGPPANVDFLGYPILESNFGGGLGPGNLGMGMAMMSNNGMLTMNIGVDHAILSGQPQAQELIDNINAEIRMLNEDSRV